MSEYDEEFEEAYKDETGKYTECEVLQLLVYCLDASRDTPLNDVVRTALTDHMMTLLAGYESWLLRPADRREHSYDAKMAKASAVVYVKAHPDEKRAIAKLYGISTRTLNRWIKRYSVGGGGWIIDDIKYTSEIYKQER